MRQLPPLLGLSVLLLGAAAGCDPQLSSRYTGESLLTIVGSVEISNDRTHGRRLVPALASLNESLGSVSIQEVSVRGQFPSDFRIDVFEPPPDEAFMNWTHQKSGEPPVAMSFITAVSDDHPDTIRFGTEGSTTVFSCTQETCDQPCGGKGCLVSRDEFCVSEDPSVPCYTEEMYCPTFNSPREQCSIEPIGGNPALKDSPWDMFAGFSQNYLVLFLRERAPAGSVTAAMLGAADGVPRGYGLYAVRPPSEADVAANEACTAQAEVRAASAWNEEYDANLTTLNFETVCAPTSRGAPSLPGTPSTPPPPTEFAAPFCGGNIDEQDKLDDALEARERLIEAAKLQLGCSILDFALERVKNPANEPVSVIIGPEVQPLQLRN